MRSFGIGNLCVNRAFLVLIARFAFLDSNT